MANIPNQKQLTDIMQILAGQGFDWDQDFFANKPEQPGGYRQSDPYLGRPVTNALNTLSPFAGMASQALGLDKRLSDALLPGVFSSRGSMFQPTNPANSLINQKLNQQYTQGAAFDNTLRDSMKRNMMEGMYRAQGYSDEVNPKTGLSPAQDAAKAAMSNMLNPMNLAATALSMSQDFRGMDRELKTGMLNSGIMTHMELPGAAGALSDSQKRLIYGAKGEAAYAAEQGEARTNAVAANKGLMKDFAMNPGQYGGFGAQGVGQIGAEMARTGAIDYGKLGKGGDISKQVQKMTKALDPLRELFGDDIPKLMEMLDKSLGTNAMATFSPDQIQAKALQLKHTAAVTGTSVDTMGRMIGASQSYFERVGLDKSGGFQAAVDAANLLSGKKDTKRLDEEGYRGKTLQVLSAQQERTETKLASGAFVMWQNKNKAKLIDKEGKELSTEQQMAKFQEEIGGARSAGAMARKLGISVKDIEQAARTAEAKDVRQQTDLASFQLGNRQKEYMTERDKIIKTAMKGRTITGDITGKSIDDIKAQWKKEHPNDVLNLPTSLLDAAAAHKIGQGFDQTKAEQLGKDMREAGYKKGEAIKRAAIDKKFSDAGIGRAYGLTGIMEFLSNAKGDKSVVADLVGSVMGVAPATKEVQAIVTGLSGKEGKAAAAKRRGAVKDGGLGAKSGEFDKIIQAVITGATESGQALGTDKKTMDVKNRVMAALADPNTKPEDLSKIMEDAGKLGMTVQGSERQGIKQLVHGDKKYKKMSKEEKTAEKELQKKLLADYDKVANDPEATGKQREDAKRGIAFSIGAKEAGMSEAQQKSVQEAYAKSQKEGTTFDLGRTLKDAKIGDKEAEKFKKGYEGAGEKMGISTKPDFMQEIVKMLGQLLGIAQQRDNNK